MIFQNTPIDNSAALAEALTAAGLARKALDDTRAELEQKKTELLSLEAERGRLSAELDVTRSQLLELKSVNVKPGAALGELST